MSVTVDNRPLAVEQLGLKTVGEVLSHIQKDRRLAVHILIDGQAPEPGQFGSLRNVELAGHTIYVETADPRQLALEVFDGVADQLEQAEQARQRACDMLARNQPSSALEQLNICLRAWQHAQEAIGKTAALLRIPLQDVRVEDKPISELLEGFASHLRQIRAALEQRDYVMLGDVLTYETETVSARWRQCIATMTAMVNSLE